MQFPPPRVRTQSSIGDLNVIVWRRCHRWRIYRSAPKGIGTRFNGEPVESRTGPRKGVGILLPTAIGGPCGGPAIGCWLLLRRCAKLDAGGNDAPSLHRRPSSAANEDGGPPLLSLGSAIGGSGRDPSLTYAAKDRPVAKLGRATAFPGSALSVHQQGTSHVRQGPRVYRFLG